MNGLYVVAGATGAIGRQLCHRIVKLGGTPLLIGRSVDKLQEVERELGGTYPIIGGIDFAQPTIAGEKLAAELKNESSIQGLAYAVGSITLKPLKGTKEHDFVESYYVNVLGAVELIKASLNALKKGASTTNPTSIVLFSSVAVQHGFTNHSVISCSKGAVEGLTHALAAELVTANIRVNCIAPSLTTGSAMSSRMTTNEIMADAIAKSHPIQRLGVPDDSAAAAAYLLSSESSWITGTILPVDGGRSTITK